MAYCIMVRSMKHGVCLGANTALSGISSLFLAKVSEFPVSCFTLCKLGVILVSTPQGRVVKQF